MSSASHGELEEPHDGLALWLSDNHMVVDGMSDDERSLLVLYATETGNAQEVADRISRQCRRLHFKCRVMSMDAYSLSDLISEELVIFVVSTTGSGTEPRSMTPLWKMLLRADLPEDLFQDLPIAVFGLGDTGYDKFCWPAKRISRRMTSLGAIEICERGEGDDQHQLGIDGALEPWLGKLTDGLMHYFPLPEGVEVVPESQIPPSRVSLEELRGMAGEGLKVPTRHDKASCEATVRINRRITAEGWFQDVRHFEFDFEDDISYSPGDVAAIYPTADDDEVESFLEAMGWANAADAPLKITHVMEDQTLPDNLPESITLRTIFSRYLDFNAVPRRSFFQYLRYFTEDEMEREKLGEFLSLEGEGPEDLYEYCHQVRRTIREVLSDFWHVKIPQEYIFDVFPPLRLRQFSIASSVKKYPKQIHLCVAVVQYKTRLKVPRKGVCSTYLAKLKPGDKIQIGIQKGLLQHPPRSDTPIVCIGPGTGVAPMRSLIEERVTNGSTVNTLYFGCRSASKDQHYGDEWKELSKEEELTYRVACSRDGLEGIKRTYVQDLIREDAERIWQLIGKGRAWVYISGSSNKMPAAVKEAIVHSVRTCGGYSEDDAQKYIDTMIREGRLLEECWS